MFSVEKVDENVCIVTCSFNCFVTKHLCELFFVLDKWKGYSYKISFILINISSHSSYHFTSISRLVILIFHISGENVTIPDLV